MTDLTACGSKYIEIAKGVHVQCAKSGKNCLAAGAVCEPEKIEKTLAFRSSDAAGAPAGWNYLTSDPADSNTCNTYRFSPGWTGTSFWPPKLAGVVGLEENGKTLLDWSKMDWSTNFKQYIGPGNSATFDMNFCDSVSMKLFVAVPWHQDFPQRDAPLQYKDSSGNWQDSAASRRLVTGYGMFSLSNNNAKNLVIGPASETSRFWRVKWSTYDYMGGFQATVSR
eukprot:CAMPEP_0197623974 /NCGR_PEP_ID=MMETSP1338-20131121/3823_1 /TAXON_ID=43686 ORGANISM="Pelagodinium beii, Strain RCC1491" /NCGR_SAMPLE_ID=MMETSP1338 /ASSEMBLY_ACC=CAM_ASM_000754 /LENGTH=223 /DNA_ID=CAMNT_0043194069 /DNA_START=106 /DNA_END=777 /DNA_ORIENTATION=-